MSTRPNRHRRLAPAARRRDGAAARPCGGVAHQGRAAAPGTGRTRAPLPGLATRRGPRTGGSGGSAGFALPPNRKRTRTQHQQGIRHQRGQNGAEDGDGPGGARGRIEGYRRSAGTTAGPASRHQERRPDQLRGTIDDGRISPAAPRTVADRAADRPRGRCETAPRSATPARGHPPRSSAHRCPRGARGPGRPGAAWPDAG